MRFKQNGLNILIILLCTFLFVSVGRKSGETIKIIEKPINSASDIIPINDSLVIPYVYTSTVSLGNLPIDEKKKKFFDMMLPAILVAKKELKIVLQKVNSISEKAELSHEETSFIENLKEKYNASSIEILKRRLHTFPVSIVLAQAAIESAWGTSRFFIEANNPFGLWSFNPDQERIMASSTRAGKKVYLRKFNNLEQAIDGYFTTLSTGPYSDFRSERIITDDPYILVNYLIDYSERREAYVEELSHVIRTNDLVKYDKYKLAPIYLIWN
ncbi:MAG: glucosaminidase domain-containing protein [Bacteroidetes bacterium]|nr:glucosaminidase domain-containing protein [Bacteroidota bacterium]MBL6943640.1 glucosaminidase domain-containing protein [Bacteroidales bacterium]